MSSPTRIRITTPEGIAYFYLQRAMTIIEWADHRASAADGPVGHVRDEMTDREWRNLYMSLKKAREALAAVSR